MSLQSFLVWESHVIHISGVILYQFIYTFIKCLCSDFAAACPIIGLHNNAVTRLPHEHFYFKEVWSSGFLIIMYGLWVLLQQSPIEKYARSDWWYLYFHPSLEEGACKFEARMYKSVSLIMITTVLWQISPFLQFFLLSILPLLL